MDFVQICRPEKCIRKPVTVDTPIIPAFLVDGQKYIFQ